jgi:YesN/AraC family two-component response regulator
MNSRDVSVLINKHLNQHFFDFVNEYRIKEAMKILKDPAKKEIMVLEILYEVGLIQNLLLILLLKRTQIAQRRNLKRKHYFNILIYY